MRIHDEWLEYVAIDMAIRRIVVLFLLVPSAFSSTGRLLALPRRVIGSCTGQYFVVVLLPRCCARMRGRNDWQV